MPMLVLGGSVRDIWIDPEGAALQLRAARGSRAGAGPDVPKPCPQGSRGVQKWSGVCKRFLGRAGGT